LSGAAISENADLYIRFPAIAAHPAEAECVVVARDDYPKGQVPMGRVVLKSGETIADAEDLQQQLITRFSSS